jgi:hypothetical protein
MAKISHNKITTLFWRKKAKINLHQNFPIYGFFYLHGGRTILKDARNCETLQFATHLITDEINEMRTTRWAPYMLQTMVLYNVLVLTCFMYRDLHVTPEAVVDLRCELKARSWRGVLDTTVCDKVCQ